LSLLIIGKYCIVFYLRVSFTKTRVRVW